MARVGLSQSFYAIYSAAGNTVTYSNGGTLGKAVEASIELDNADPVIFYANNGPAESAQQFSGGTLTITNDRLPLAAVAALMGLNTNTSSTPAGTTLDFPASLTPPYVGYGTVVKSIVDNAEQYMAIILTKVQFQVPTDTATTQGETVEFTGHEFNAIIMRDDTTDGLWKKYGVFTTEADAITWVKSFLAIT